RRRRRSPPRASRECRWPSAASAWGRSSLSLRCAGCCCRRREQWAADLVGGGERGIVTVDRRWRALVVGHRRRHLHAMVGEATPVRLARRSHGGIAAPKASLRELVLARLAGGVVLRLIDAGRRLSQPAAAPAPG